MKKGFIVVVALVVCLSFTGICFAESTTEPQATPQQEEIMPYWTGLISITTSMKENPTGYACPFYSVTADRDKIDKVRFVTTLQKYDIAKGSWVSVKSWDKTVELYEITITYHESYQGTTANTTYRFTYTLYAKKGTKIIDTVTGNSPSRVI